jgi:hypothetical protein
MRYVMIVVLAMIATIALISGLLNASSGRADQTVSIATPSAIPMPTAPPPVQEPADPSGLANAEGGSAIKVRGERLTPQEVIAFIATDGVMGADGPVSVTQVECLVGKAAMEKYGDGIRTRDDREVCVAIVAGEFSVAVPPSDDSDQSTFKLTKATVVFDAVTGNILAVGIGD